MKLKTFTVEGSHAFPIDMLRYVPCWPANETDSAAVAGSHTRRVTLETFSAAEIEPERWKSFLWRVVEDTRRHA